MRISFVADYRSPIARQWIDGVASLGHEVHVVSSRPLGAPPPPDYPVDVVPLGPLGTIQAVANRTRRGIGRPSTPAVRTGSTSALERVERLLRRVGPYEVKMHRRALRAKLLAFRPELVHAMRLPYEAIAAAQSWTGRPLIGSIWGNDLTLHALRYPAVGHATRITLGRLSALHTDCRRDQREALKWGFDPDKPSIVLPGSGGVDTDRFRPGPSKLRDSLGIPLTAPVVLNPRGVRGYVHIPEFLEATAIVLGRRADVHFVCTGMRGRSKIEAEVRRMPGGCRVHLLPDLRHDEMPELFRLADVCVSLSSHDGTPNSLLEALASGCFPIVGPVAAVLEWITEGSNGMVVVPTAPAVVAHKIIFALEAVDFRARAREANLRLIHRRARLGPGMDAAVDFYQLLLDTCARTARVAGRG